MGVNWKKLYRPPQPPSTIEETFDLIEKITIKARTLIPDKSRPVVIVIDSIAALVGKEEVETAHNDSIAMGLEARALSRSLRKIVPTLDSGHVTLVCINQTREKIGTFSFGDNETTSHGKALGFYASVRVKLKSIGQIKNTKTGQVIGVKTEAKVFKNKVGPSHRSVNFPIYYDWGVQDDISLMDYLIDIEEIKGTSWRTLTVNGESFRWQGTQEFVQQMKRPEIRKYVLDIVDKNMVYTFDRKPESIEIDTNSLLEMEQLKQDLEKK